MKTVTTENGLVVSINGLSPFKPDEYGVEFDSVNPEPQPPTYTALTVGGGVEIHKHDSKSLPEERERPEGEDNIDAIKEWEEDMAVIAEWNKYVADHDIWQTKRNEYQLVESLLEGVEVDIDTPHFDSWKKKQEKRLKKLGLKLTEDEDELKIKYIKTGIINSADDMAELLAAILGSTGVPQARIEAVRKSFKS